MHIGTLLPLLGLIGLVAVGYGWMRLKNPRRPGATTARGVAGTDSVHGTRGGYAFTGRGERRVLGSSRDMDDDQHFHEDDFYRVSIQLARPVAPLRIQARAPLGSYQAHVVDANAGAVATGHPQFDDRFLVHCDDVALVRRLMTPELARWILDNRLSARFTARDKDLSGIELKDGSVSVEGRGSKLVPERTNQAVDYLVGLVGLLPPELAPVRGRPS